MWASRSLLFVTILFAVLLLLSSNENVVNGSKQSENEFNANDSSINERLPTDIIEEASNRRAIWVTNNITDYASKEVKLKCKRTVIIQKHNNAIFDEEYQECVRSERRLREADYNNRYSFYIPSWFLMVTIAVGLTALVTITMLIRILFFSICFTLRLHSVEGIVIFNGDILEPVENERSRYIIAPEANYVTGANHNNTTLIRAENNSNNYSRHNSIGSRDNTTHTPFISVTDALPSYEEQQQQPLLSPPINILTSRAARLSLMNMATNTNNRTRSNDVSVVDSTAMSLRQEEHSSHEQEGRLNQSPLHLHDNNISGHDTVFTSATLQSNENGLSHLSVNDDNHNESQSVLLHNDLRRQSHGNLHVPNDHTSFTGLDHLQPRRVRQTTEMATHFDQEEAHETHVPYGDEHVVFIYSTPTMLPSLPVPRTSLIFEIPPITEAFHINLNFRQWLPFITRRRRAHRNNNNINNNNNEYQSPVVHRVSDEHANNSVLRNEQELIQHHRQQEQVQEHHHEEHENQQEVENYHSQQVNHSFVPTLSSTLPLPLSLPQTRTTSPFNVPSGSSASLSHTLHHHREVSMSAQQTQNEIGNQVGVNNNTNNNNNSNNNNRVSSESSETSAENALLSNRVFYSGRINHEWPCTLPPFEMTFPSALEVPLQMKQYIKPERARRRGIHKKKKYRKLFTELNGEYDGQLFSMWDMPAWSLFNPTRLYWYWIFHTSISNETAIGCPVGSAEVNPDEDVIVGPNGELRYRHHPYLRAGSEHGSWLEQNLCISRHHHHRHDDHRFEESVWGCEESEISNLHRACTWSYNREMEDLPESHVVSYHAENSYRHLNSTNEHLHGNTTTNLKDDFILRDYRLAFIPYHPRTPNAPPDYTVIEEDEEQEGNRACWNENEVLMSDTNDDKDNKDDTNDDRSILFSISSFKYDTPLLASCNSDESGRSNNNSSNTNNISSNTSNNFDAIVRDSNDVTSNDNNYKSSSIISNNNDKFDKVVSNGKKEDNDNIIASGLEENVSTFSNADELNVPNCDNNYGVLNRK